MHAILLKTKKYGQVNGGQTAALMALNKALTIPLICFVTTLNSLTSKSELTLIFESGDPFADEDAGDCG